MLAVFMGLGPWEIFMIMVTGGVVFLALGRLGKSNLKRQRRNGSGTGPAGNSWFNAKLILLLLVVIAALLAAILYLLFKKNGG